MKKFTTLLASMCMVLCACLLLTACAQTKDGGTAVHDASLTGWRDYQGEETGNQQYSLLDTSVVLNFDELDITKIDKITFEIYQNKTKLGNAVSEDQKLQALFTECLKYWKDGSQQNFNKIEDVTGQQTLSCNFYTLENPDEAVFDDIWTYSKNTVKQTENDANKVIVKVLVGETEYVTQYQTPAAV